MRQTQSSGAQGSKLPVNIHERGSVRLHDPARPLSLLVRIVRLILRVGGGDDLGRSSRGMFRGHKPFVVSYHCLVAWSMWHFPNRKMPRV